MQKHYVCFFGLLFSTLIVGACDNSAGGDDVDTEPAELGVEGQNGNDVGSDDNDSVSEGAPADTESELMDTIVTQETTDDSENDTSVGSDLADSDSIGDIETDSDSSLSHTLAKRTLAPVQTCDAAWEILRQQYVDEMVALVNEKRQQVLANADMSEDDCEEWYIYEDEWDYDTDWGGVPSSDADADADADADEEGASEYSTTNNQVAGVDEADFLKNDGNYIYILADGMFQIVDAWPAADAHGISQIAIEGEPKKLFIYEDKAVIYSSLNAINSLDTNFRYASRYGTSECTYGYDCDFVGDGRELRITVLDISNLMAPTVIRETTMNGSYLNARRIGDAIYTVVIFPDLIPRMPTMSYVPNGLNLYDCGEDITASTEEINAAFDALIAYNTSIINLFDFEATLPSVIDRRIADGKVASTTTAGKDCSHFYMSQTGDGNNLITVLGLDVAADAEYTMASIVSRPGAVYADGDSLYLAMRHYRSSMNGWFFEDEMNVDEATTVHKFNLDNDTATATYQGSGLVKGRILNQFAMDEYDGHLRIATTTGHVPAPNVHSTMSVLNVEGEGNLSLTGQVDDIAPTEDIRSARFNGDRGFIVTFKKTDPLFVFDLSDPNAPVIAGELKIPGFSTYMHLMDDTHILSIGFDAEDAGTRAYFQGIQLQVMDISDVANPTLLHKEVIGTRGSTSDAATDHLAFNYFKSLNQLAIPMVVCEVSSGGSDYGDVMTFSGLMVYNVTVEDGFKYLGGIPHFEPEVDGQQSGMCSNWWTDGHSQVKRSIFMDDYVYSIAPELINVSNINDLEHPVSAVSLVAP